jgi:hypothetical protein
MTCKTCGITYAVPPQWLAERREDHQTWYCPNGHHWHFPGKSDTEKLRDELQRERARLDQANAEADYQRKQRAAAERRTSAARGQVTKIKNRVAHGVCPCCSRSFSDLRRHMATKHPDYTKPEAEAKA